MGALVTVMVSRSSRRGATSHLRLPRPWSPAGGRRRQIPLMVDSREVIRRIERREEMDWRTQYARLLPPVPTPTRTPACTCDWIEERVLCAAESELVHILYGADCPDHQEPEATPVISASFDPRCAARLSSKSATPPERLDQTSLTYRSQLAEGGRDEG